MKQYIRYDRTYLWLSKQTAVEQLTRACFINDHPIVAAIPQGLKPLVFPAFSARLKSCPDTKQVYETRSNRPPPPPRVQAPGPARQYL